MLTAVLGSRKSELVVLEMIFRSKRCLFLFIRSRSPMKVEKTKLPLAGGWGVSCKTRPAGWGSHTRPGWPYGTCEKTKSALVDSPTL